MKRQDQRQKCAPVFKCVCVFALFGKEREDDEDVGDDDDDANPMIDVSAPSAATFFTTLILGV